MHDTKQTSEIPVTIISIIPPCTASNLTELLRAIAHLYCPSTPQQDQAYDNTCVALANHLSGILKIEPCSNDHFSVIKENRRTSNHLQERLRRQLQCLQEITPKLHDQQTGQSVGFENLAEYIESKRTLEALVGILLPLIAGK
ncbi:MAG: hypothetical protein ACTHMC_17770 [Pseudobacter sp.]|uniref:hypothetical protein n=1 Tax=Pseudobacter sp. TaxID=2045420 RepID=UPI003F7E80CC